MHLPPFFKEKTERLQNPYRFFKLVKNGALLSVRISLGYHALGVPVNEGV